ncbi:H-NS histone family protein [Parasulfuritortus cantonensis]|uniref:H-NS histone family protein n=1 Tax=Parasulfuritortus cantonensis TaxID=2528202 RepID=A0A4R1B507_9PROT|nr:H-NS histone family protein [Parasulfuritortus cantonensis]
MDLKTLSVAELKALQKDIAVEMELRGKEERQKLLQEFRDKAKALGVSLEELLAAPKPRAAGKVAAKYANPANPEQTWTGRGKRPLWVGECLASGKTLDDLKV